VAPVCEDQLADGVGFAATVGGHTAEVCPTCSPPAGLVEAAPTLQDVEAGGVRGRGLPVCGRWRGRGAPAGRQAPVGAGHLQTEGAREVQEVAPVGVAWLWTFPGVVQTCGSIWARCPAMRIACWKSARESGDRARTGTETLAREGHQAPRSWERPPPGTMECRWG
jgi:hypothetical protein